MILFFFFITVIIFRGVLFPIIHNYEKSGNDGEQRQETDEDLGSTNLMCTRVVAGDDCSGILNEGGTEPENKKYFYLLYFWHLLDQGGLVQFTLAKLPNYIAADSESFNLILSQKGTGSQYDNRAKLVAAVGQVAAGFGTITNKMKQENIDMKQKQLFDVEMGLANPDLLTTYQWREPVLKKT